MVRTDCWSPHGVLPAGVDGLGVHLVHYPRSLHTCIVPLPQILCERIFFVSVPVSGVRANGRNVASLCLRRGSNALRYLGAALLRVPLGQGRESYWKRSTSWRRLRCCSVSHYARLAAYLRTPQATYGSALSGYSTGDGTPPCPFGRNCT